MKNIIQRFLKEFLFILIFSLALSVSAQDVIYQFTEAYTSPLKGKYGREAVFQDQLLWTIANGSWTTPEEKSNSGNSSEEGISWQKIESNDKGVFRHRNLRGGYLYCEYTAKKTMTVVLEVSGHNEVYVNGEPRGGDVYNFGWVQHPVQLKKGKNTFLFRGSRGQLNAKLVQTPGKLFLSSRDALLPDWQKGSDKDALGAVRLINASNKELRGYRIKSLVNGKENKSIDIPLIGPLTSRKIPFSVNVTGSDSDDHFNISFVIIGPNGKTVEFGEVPEFKINVKGAFDKRKETFISEIDGSVQYYSVVPSSVEVENPSLFLSLHGASVEAVNQAGAYSPKDWGVLVAPTNRRPYGFDWEDWGRLDAREVLKLATDKYKPDPNRVYLTGHSMGGHGTWQFGVSYPGNWAAIAPSAGWYSFWSYAGKEEVESPSPIEQVFKKSSNPSNTLGLSKNYLHYGVYILHGDQDDNVPVSQAREMREHLAGYHPDFCYYERPGAGHWWGNECVDWPPLFEFFRNHSRPELDEIKSIDFSTSSPGVSSTSRFVTIWQQEKSLEISNVKVSQNTEAKEITFQTDNVKLLKIDLSHLQSGQPYQIICAKDSFKIDPGVVNELFLSKQNERWSIVEKPSLNKKGPHRYGMFKEAFQNNMVFVYGTNGDKNENQWAYAKARFDAETFWYRGNGAVDVISDQEFIGGAYEGRNLILYGHGDMNLAWDKTIPDSPIKVERGRLLFGDEIVSGDDLSVNFIYPRKGDDKSSVGVVAGTGRKGMVSAYANRYFVSGSGFPDYMIFKTDMLNNGIEDIVAAGFFDTNWNLSEEEGVFSK